MRGLAAFFGDITELVVAPFQGLATVIVEVHAGFDLPAWRVVTIDVAEIFPYRAAGFHLAFLDEIPRVVVAENDAPDHPVILVIKHLFGGPVRVIKQRHDGDGATGEMQHRLDGKPTFSRDVPARPGCRVPDRSMRFLPSD
ncbi:MAG: hypothetical protein LAP39_23025 [Acidobacteriia bacterium]|nr:hypothetical protein [Terriglobia bacterium]